MTKIEYTDYARKRMQERQIPGAKIGEVDSNMIEHGNVRYDEKADILYIHGRSGPAVSEEVIPGVSVDVDEKSGEILGIEILEASKILEPFIEGLRARIKVPAP